MIMVKRRKCFDYNKRTKSDTDAEVNKNEAKSNNKRADYESSSLEESDDKTNIQTKNLPIVIPKKRRKHFVQDY